MRVPLNRQLLRRVRSIETIVERVYDSSRKINYYIHLASVNDQVHIHHKLNIQSLIEFRFRT